MAYPYSFSLHKIELLRRKPWIKQLLAMTVLSPLKKPFGRLSVDSCRTKVLSMDRCTASDARSAANFCAIKRLKDNVGTLSPSVSFPASFARQLAMPENFHLFMRLPARRRPAIFAVHLKPTNHEPEILQHQLLFFSSRRSQNQKACTG